MSLKQKFDDFRDREQIKKAANERAILDKYVSELQAIDLRGVRTKVGDAMVSQYYKNIDEIVRLLQDVDPGKYDPWEVNQHLEQIIGELKDAAQRREKDGIEACLKALKYTALARQMKIPAKHNAQQYMEKRLKDIEAYRVIITRQKEIDEAAESIRKQQARRDQLAQERDAAKQDADVYKEGHIVAAAEVAEFSKHNGEDHVFSPQAQIYKTKMNKALDLRDDVENLEYMIARNTDAANELEAAIRQMEAVLSQRLLGLDEETIKQSEEIQQDLLSQLDSIEQSAKKLRKNNKKLHATLKNMAATEEMRKGMMQTLSEYEKLELEESNREINEAKARGMMLKEEAEREARKAGLLKQLQAQEEENRKLKETARQEIENALDNLYAMEEPVVEEVLGEELEEEMEVL